MATIPVPRTWVPNEFVTDTIMNGSTGIRDALSFLLSPPVCKVRQTVVQSLTASAYTSLTFTTEDVDSDGIHSTVTNTSRLTIVTPGWYLLAGMVGFATSSVGRRGTRWALNGAAMSATQQILPANATGGMNVVAATTLVALIAGDFVELQGFQDSGGALNTIITGVEAQSYALARWMSP